MEKLIEIVLALVIVGTTLAFGGVQSPAYTFMEAIIFLLLLVVVLRQVREERVNLEVPIWPVLFACVAVLQVVPLPVRVVSYLSPERGLDVSSATAILGKTGWVSLSVYPHDTIAVLIRFLAYLSTFVLACRVFNSHNNRSLLITTLLLLGCGEAGYGIVQYIAGWHQIFTYVNEYGQEGATGTFINRNHFAGLLELTLPFALAVVFYHFQRRMGHRHSRRAPGRRGSPGSMSIFYLNLAAVIVLGIIFSRSRAGILSACLGILFVAVLAQLRVKRKVWALAVLVFLIVVGSYGLWIGLGPVLSRFEQVQKPGLIKIEGRIPFWKDTLRMVRDYPLTGTGLGTFGFAFRRYQTTSISLFVPHAHNDYLEFASDTGLVGWALLFLPIFSLFGRMVVSFWADSNIYRRSITLGCIGSVFMLLVHSFVDFNLQIPANALIFSVILGIGYKTSCLEPKTERKAGAAEVSPERYVSRRVAVESFRERST